MSKSFLAGTQFVLDGLLFLKNLIDFSISSSGEADSSTSIIASFGHSKRSGCSTSSGMGMNQPEKWAFYSIHGYGSKIPGSKILRFSRAF